MSRYRTHILVMLLLTMVLIACLLIAFPLRAEPVRCEWVDGAIAQNCAASYNTATRTIKLETPLFADSFD